MLKEKAKSEGKQLETFILEVLEKQLKEYKKKALERLKELPTFNLGGTEITREFRRWECPPNCVNLTG